MQPLETEPTTVPSSASAMIEPIDRGDEPRMRTTADSTAHRPVWRESRNWHSTTTSGFFCRQWDPAGTDPRMVSVAQ